jgi:hypothetical protein
MAKTWVVFRVADGDTCRECGALEPEDWEHLLSHQPDCLALVRAGFTSEEDAERFARSG